MIFDDESHTLSFKDKVYAEDAGVISMYTIYALTDTFLPRGFQLGIGVS